MLIIITALYCEAKPFIERYQLTRDLTYTRFQVFEGKDILLLITGQGSIAAATAVSYLCALRQPSSEDILVNIGICGAWTDNMQKGKVYLINKIIETATERCFYPDVVFRHPFIESELVTVSSIVSTDSISSGKAQELSGRGRLFDMEASAVYQAASYYLQPHQIIILKLISDYGDGNRMTSEEVTMLLEQNADEIYAYLDSVRSAFIRNESIFNEEEEGKIKELADCLHCSVTMEYQLRQLLYYDKLVHGNIQEVIEAFCAEHQLPCKSKKEGLRYLEQLRARII